MSRYDKIQLPNTQQLFMLSGKHQLFLDLNTTALIENFGDINMFASQVLRCILPKNIVG